MLLQLLRYLPILLVPIYASSSPTQDIFSDITRNCPPIISSDYFGMHFHRLVLVPNEAKQRTAWPEAKIGSIRLWDSNTRWADISPAGGQWKFDVLDALVSRADNHHAHILYTLGSTPRWLSARPDESCPYGKGCAAEPARIAHWEEYVRRTVTRYKGKIEAYELWNEPFFSELKNEKGPSDFYYGSVKKMVEMAQVARTAINEVDPAALLVSPGFTGNTNQLELFLSTGGKNYVDVISYHFYANDANEFAQKIAEVRRVMARQGVSHLPIWNTETGLEVDSGREPSPPGTQMRSQLDGAALMIQYLILGAAAGLDRYYYYAWDNERSGMISSGQASQPAKTSYLKLQDWMLGAQFSGCKSQGKLVVCTAVKRQKKYLFVWASKPIESHVPIADGMKVTSVDRMMEVTPQPPRTGNTKIGFDSMPIRFEIVPQ